MKSILYVMHISWGWIKQRPQFIAEGLAKDYKVDVFYRMSNHLRKGLNPSFNNGNLKVQGFRDLPLERIPGMTMACSVLINKLFWKINKINWDEYDYIWVTDPVIWKFIKPKQLPSNVKLIYDCMDDYSEFPYMKDHPRYTKYLEHREAELLNSANSVICSAESLANKLQQKYGINRKFHIINNAITEDITKYSTDITDLAIPKNSLIYIGTISEWLDYENLLKLLDKYKKLNIVLFGPMRTTNFPNHPRLIFKGTISHDKILSVMKQSMGLIMPFVVTPLIESVNPVKIYEYAYSGKPIIATRYAETLKFSDYVCLYSNFEELSSFVASILANQIQPNQQKMVDFAMNNTWGNRIYEINNILHE